MYAAQCTRLDISFAVSRLSNFMNCYDEEHWSGVEQVLRYLAANRHFGLRYYADQDKSQRNVLTGWVDSDWASDTNDRKSQT